MTDKPVPCKVIPATYEIREPGRVTRITLEIEYPSYEDMCCDHDSVNWVNAVSHTLWCILGAIKVDR